MAPSAGPSTPPLVAETEAHGATVPRSPMPAMRDDADRVLPIALNPRRFWLWSIALVFMSAMTVVAAPLHRFVDFPQFWYAGNLAGTPDLLDPVRQIAWEVAHGFEPREFLYPPGTAWLYAPLSHVSLAAAFWIHAAVIWAIALACGAFAARAFALDRRVALVATLAWAPVLAAAAVGHNVPLALLLALVAIDALRRDRDAVAGVAVALMLFKPTLALPLLVLFVLRRRWAALAATIPIAAAWYLLCVAATAGDWLWPVHWLAAIGPYMQGNFEKNAGLTISVPELLLGHGVPAIVAYGVGLAIVVAALPRLLHVPIAEAAAAACAVGVVASQHSLQYEASMLLPLLLWAAAGIRDPGTEVSAAGARLAEPWRTRVLVAAYLVAELYLATPVLGFSALLVVALGAVLVWVTGWWRSGPALVPEPAPRWTGSDA